MFYMYTCIRKFSNKKMYLSVNLQATDDASGFPSQTPPPYSHERRK